MKIAHVTDFYLPRLGGIEMHVSDLAQRQQAAGHTVEVITASPRPRGERTPDGRDVSSDGVVVHRLTESAPLPAAYHPKSVVSGRRIVEKGGYDVVHIHAGIISPLAFTALSYASHVPTVVTIHSLLSFAEPVYRSLKPLSGWSRWPAVWTAVSDVAAEPLRRLVDPAPVYVLPNGIDPSQWRVEPEARDDDEMLIAAVMRLVPRKRPIHMLRMLRRAQSALGSDVQLRVVIAGDGPKRGKVERYLHRHEMADWVELPGRLSRDEIRSLLGRSDLFLAPATLESFGIAALEARCAGVPVLARAEGGIAEFINDGEEGVLAPSDGDMVEALVRLARNPGEREKIAARNREVQPAVAWPDVLRETERIYEIAIARHRPASSRGLFGVAG